MKKLLHSTLILFCALAQTFAEGKRPNIILFLADDMGDLGAYGNADVSTPNIDQLAAGGLRLTDAHSPAAVCQPTRYGILSGRYYGRSAYGRIQSGIYFRKDEVLFPRLLQKAGYNTAAFGKWHLGFGLTNRGEPTDWNGELKPGPNECGFDWFFGMPQSHAQPPYVFVENSRVYKGDLNDPIEIISSEDAKARGIKPPANAPSGWGMSIGGKAAHEACDMNRLDLIMADKACEFIARQSAEKPFFIYLPWFAPHVPLAVAEEFRGKSPLGQRIKKHNNNAVRNAEYCNQLDFAVGKVMACLQERGNQDRHLGGRSPRSHDRMVARQNSRRQDDQQTFFTDRSLRHLPGGGGCACAAGRGRGQRQYAAAPPRSRQGARSRWHVLQRKGQRPSRR